MPVRLGGAIPDDPRKVETVKLILSSQLKNKGQSAMRSSVTGFSPSDSEIAGAIIAGATANPPSFALATPTPGNQGAEGSCVGFSLAYACRSIEQYYSKGASSYSNSVNVFSPEYVYNQVWKADCATGTSITLVLDLMKNQGVCTWTVMPYDDQNGCTIMPDATQIQNALLYKIRDYWKLLVSDTAGIKAMLLAHHAVSINILADNNFVNATAGFIWSAATHGAGVLSHCITIVGYDDSKNAWKVMNSWGTSWCDSGFGYIDYDFLPTVANYYVYMLNAAPSQTDPIANAGLDQTISANDVVVLDGTGSSDPDGYIAEYLWEQVSGPSSISFDRPEAPVQTIGNLIEGDYVVKLTVTDDGTHTAVDTVKITVQAAAAAESATVAVSKSSTKGKTTDKLTWAIVVNNPPQAAELQLSTTGTSFARLYAIIPYAPQGTYSYIANAKKRRYYRVRVLKSDSTYIYSPVVSIL